jgi:hypothetical protein
MTTDSQVQGKAAIVSIASLVSSPENPFSRACDDGMVSGGPMRLASSAVALDWKLLYRSILAEGRQNVLPLLIAAAMLVNVTSSAAEAGRFVRSHPLASGGVLAFVAWMASCGAFALCLIMGHIAVGRRMAEAMRTSGRSWMEIALTTAARHFAGRQAAAAVVIMMPVISFLAAWKGVTEAVPLIVAFVLLLIAFSSGAAATRYLPVPARLLVWAALVAIAAGLLVPGLRAASLKLIVVFPPAWVALVARGGVGILAPLGFLLLFLAAMLAAETALSLRLDTAEVAGAGAISRAIGRMAMPLLASRRPVLASYGRELVIALRWRRLLALWLFGIGVGVALGSKLAPHGALLPVLACALLPVLFLAAVFSNLFGADGGGFQCHWILPIDVGGVMAAKERVLWTLASVSLLSYWAAMLLAHSVPQEPRVRLFMLCMQIAFALWLAAAGRVISVLAPHGVDVRKISGDYLSPTAVLATGLAVTLFLGVAGGAAILFDRGRMAERGLAIAGVGVLMLVILVRPALSRAAALVARNRREEILKSVLS